jgi:phosphoglycerol transferase MdoB-like AlkP superfamily enzyme
MIDYLWMFILGGISIISLVFFLISLSRDVFLIKKLRKKKQILVLNFSLLLITLSSLGLIAYLFGLLREQIELLQ